MRPFRLSLSQQNALRLALVFILFEVLVAVAVVFLLMLPMARRAANDLAGLIVLSAQTWSELPPETRPVFAQELAAAHGLTLADRLPPWPVVEARQGPYIRHLEAELVRRTGRAGHLMVLANGGETWHWATVPSGSRTIWIGFSHARFGPQPLAASALILVAGLLLAGVAAWWLARRTVAPLERFDHAAAALGRGEVPELLPESGPRELAALACRFNDLARQVRSLLDARTTLLAGLSHDLRTPLARMRLALEMLERKPDPAWIARLDADIGEMNRLVGDLLDLSRGLGGEAASRLELPDWLDAIADQASAAGQAVTVDCPPGIGAIVAPPSALRRVIENYLGNARRYAGGGPIRLCAEAHGDRLRIGVLDAGPGIPPDQLEAVFRPFHRVDASRSPDTGGAGLGLAIVHQLAQANRWRVWLENRPQGGLAAWVEMAAPIP